MQGHPKSLPPADGVPGPLAAPRGAVTAGPGTAAPASGAVPASATAPRRAAAPAASGRSSRQLAREQDVAALAQAGEALIGELQHPLGTGHAPRGRAGILQIEAAPGQG